MIVFQLRQTSCSAGRVGRASARSFLLMINLLLLLDALVCFGIANLFQFCFARNVTLEISAGPAARTWRGSSSFQQLSIVFLSRGICSTIVHERLLQNGPTGDAGTVFLPSAMVGTISASTRLTG